MFSVDHEINSLNLGYAENLPRFFLELETACLSVDS